ncbi:MAG: NAD-dependent epimerase/dehydratase family protein [Gallionellaceae bacterium]
MKLLKVVVTGGTGFLGASVLRELSRRKNVEVIPVTRRDIPAWYQVSDYSESPVGDVLIHLAEDSDRAHVEKLGKPYEEKALCTLSALLAKRYGRVVYASSAVLYGDADKGGHFSSDPILGHDSYSLIKRKAELAVLQAPSGIVARLANIYGAGMSKNNVMSTVLRQISCEGALEVWDASPVRDFVWVEDVAEGIVDLALNRINADVEGGVYNLGTGVGTSIGALASMALEIAGQSGRAVKARYSIDSESSIILNFSETTSAYGWSPKTSLRQGLARMLHILKEKE